MVERVIKSGEIIKLEMAKSDDTLRVIGWVLIISGALVFFGLIVYLFTR